LHLATNRRQEDVVSIIHQVSNVINTTITRTTNKWKHLMALQAVRACMSIMMIARPEMIQLEMESTSHLPTLTVIVVVAHNHNNDTTSTLLLNGSTAELNFGSYIKTFCN
jgi:hypothetical protein